MNISRANISFAEGLNMPENIYSDSSPAEDGNFPLFEVISAVLLSYVFIILLGKFILMANSGIVNWFAVLALRSYLANQRNLTEECCGVSDEDYDCSWDQCSKFLRTGSYTTSDNHFNDPISQNNRYITN